MSDSEYDSEDDEDYAPDEPSSEEEGVGIAKTKNQRNKTNKSSSRKRKGGIHLEDDDEVSNHEESEKEDKEEFLKTQEDDTASKKKVDDLWAAFKKDTAAVRPLTSSSVKNNTGKKVVDSEEVKTLTSVALQKEKEPPKKVEITEIFDFAGEEVKVVKSVDASSVKPVTSNDKAEVKPKTTSPLKRTGGGLGSVLGKIGKKPKLSVLEKSKLDWNSFKKDEGIADELKSSNRDGYLEKQAFLNRVDHKQFEIERDIRQGFRKK